MKQFECITKYIPELCKGDYGKAVGGLLDGDHAGTKEDPIPWPYIEYSKKVDALHDAVFTFCEAHPEYEWTEYQETLQKYGIDWGLDSMSAADVSALDAKAIIALLVAAWRAEKFCDGAVMELLQNGSIGRWLNRLAELDGDRILPITIQKADIADLAADCIVNAANAGLREGGGVCGAIFQKAGEYELKNACDAIGGCEPGGAVITPGFRLKAKYIIHAVGPQWKDGQHGEEQQLYSCYQASLKLAQANGCRTIAFPVISSGIFGYPKKEAWRVALQSVRDYQRTHDNKPAVIFAVRSDESCRLGLSVLEGLK